MTSKEQLLLYSIIGHKISEARKKAGLKQEPFARLIGLTRASVVNIEKGRQRPSIHLIWEIARKLNVAVRTLLPLDFFVSEETKVQTLRKEFKKSIDDKDAEAKIISFITEITAKDSNNEL